MGSCSFTSEIQVPVQETQEMWVQSLAWIDPLEEEMATCSSICLENSMDRGAWWVIVHRVAKGQK